MKNCVLYDQRKALHVLDVRLKQLLPDLTCNIKKLSISDNFTIFVHIPKACKKESSKYQHIFYNLYR